MVSISTLRRFALALSLGAIVMAGASCGGDGGGGTVVDYCERADSCNILVGVSTDQCIDRFETALENQPDSVRADVEGLMEGCLQFQTCELFAACDADLGT
jgi:hypothetical protein